MLFSYKTKFFMHTRIVHFALIVLFINNLGPLPLPGFDFCLALAESWALPEGARDTVHLDDFAHSLDSFFP